MNMRTKKEPQPVTEANVLSIVQWVAAALERYPSKLDIRFVCPVCHHVASAKEYLERGAPEEVIGFSCIGRYTLNPRVAFGGSGPGPCDYAGGGLFRINPIAVRMPSGKVESFFDFADRPLVARTVKKIERSQKRLAAALKHTTKVVNGCTKRLTRLEETTRSQV